MSYANPLETSPYFMFKDRENGIDAVATAEKGYEVPKITTFILIVPHGHKGDPLEFYADEFIVRKGREAKEGRYNHKWVSDFSAGYEDYKAGRVLPVNGSPMLTWERILKSRREQLASRFPTVELLAAVPDSSLGEIGLDGRVLRDLAKAEIQAKVDLAPVVKELADTKEENRRLQDQISVLAARLDSLEDDKPRRGRPAKEHESA